MIVRADTRFVVLLAGLAVACLLADTAAANPFGVARPDPSVAVQSGPLAGLFGWIAAKQSEFYRALSGLVAAFRTDPGAGWALAGLSFLYGLFHAAGPGHGKVVITSYLVATGETMRRGIVLSFAAAFVQALTAIAMVTVLTVILRATSIAMTQATGFVEIASYALIALIGARLVYGKSLALIAKMPVGSPQTVAAGAPGHGHHHHHHGHGPDCGCGHDHAPDPASLGGPFSLKRAWTAVLAVGIRPCTGALVVLVFAFSQGVYAVGVASTLAMAVGTGLAVAILAALAVGARGFAARLADDGAGWAAVGLQTVELLAALAVCAFGLLMLGGALQAGL
ncbi:nickel/cobalt transporter [Microbaculum marinisediminis]|uniref:Nickel/cobalt efflux system n=1 Tax=Microbaculum marinisediminis TaxID=2931392 RepID=A0AAW5QU53_9HYPH|nr:nickel/cobalt transporter [Microbaculum sp. A6E488]MCT8971601.1 nickel/cobalt transporter [Microbaculum sp. A6E488]